MITGTSNAGNALSQLNFPYTVQFDPRTHTIYMADNSTGTLAVPANSAGSNIQIGYPRRNIVQWVLGKSHWIEVAGVFDMGGSAPSTFSKPQDVTLDPMGNIYVADDWSSRIQFFLAGESKGITIAGVTSVYGSNSTLLKSPQALVLDNQLNIYVDDQGNHRIQKFLRY